MSDASGGIVGIDSYDSYGIPGANNIGRFQYTGQAWVPELGLFHYKARAYSPTLGRFLQVDPVGYKDDVNLYAYVGNDPVNHADPTGNEGEPGSDSWAKTAADVALGFVPVVGDAINVRDAYRNPTPTNIAIAAIGLVPELSEVGSLRRGIRSLEKQIDKHETKIAKEIANPTVKPEMKGMKPEAIKA